jgi:glycyl-tRNA synthetase beta chain
VEARADTALFSEDAERALWTDVAAVRRSADVLFETGDYTSSLKALAALRAPVDRFFDDVMVNADDPKVRANRLGLLATLHGVMNRVADLSRLST